MNILIQLLILPFVSYLPFIASVYFFFCVLAFSTPNSILVNSGAADEEEKRMTKFYHFDAASMLVIGRRVAYKLASLMS